jgi:hypothetical protein
LSQVLDGLAPRIPVGLFPKLAKLRLLSEDSLNCVARTDQKRGFRLRWVRCNPTVDFFGVGVSVTEVPEQASQHFTRGKRVASNVLIQVLIPNVFKFNERGLD